MFLRKTSLASTVVRAHNSGMRIAQKATLTREELTKYLTTPPYTLPNQKKIQAPPMVYISGEEMTHYTMQLMLVSIFFLLNVTTVLMCLSMSFCILRCAAWINGSSHTSIPASGSTSTCLARIVMQLMTKS